MVMRCKVCGRNAHSEYCFLHKPRKSLARKPLQVTSFITRHSKPKVDSNTTQMRNFFLEVWKHKKQHICEECGEWLGGEPLSYMFDHIIEKSKHPELKYEEENIQLLCLKHHDEKSRGIYSEKIKDKIEQTKEKFNIFD